MGENRSNERDGVMRRLRERLGLCHRSLERKLHGVLDEAGNAQCCSVDKVAFTKSLLEPEDGRRPPDSDTRPA
jgi:hypothetical protein